MDVLGLLLFLVLITLCGTASSLKAADFFQICRKRDPNINDCIKSTLHQLRPTLKIGIPALKMPSVEPMIVPRIALLQGDGPVSIDSTFINTHIEGISNFAVQSVTADVDDYKIDVTVALPYLYVHGDYEIKGRVLLLPIRGNGDSWSNYTDVTGTASLIGHPVTRNGKLFMKVDEFKFGINVKNARIQMNNLFGGNKQLGDVMNNFISENWELFFSELKPVVDEAISALLKNLADRVFDKFPYAELFPN